MDGQGSEP
jgi:hypothetical protein